MDESLGRTARFLADYPQRPATLSRDAPSAQQMAALEQTVAAWLPAAVPAAHWTTSSSVGLGNLGR
jgi:hypothetical protein